MIVRMNEDVTAAGPAGTLCGGQTGELPDEMARELVAGGYAVELKASAEEPSADLEGAADALEDAEAPEAENAALEAPETATRPPQRKAKKPAKPKKAAKK